MDRCTRCARLGVECKPRELPVARGLVRKRRRYAEKEENTSMVGVAVSLLLNLSREQAALN